MDGSGAEGVLHALKRDLSDEDDGGVETDDADARDLVGHGRIRCPVCRWQPRKHDRWACTCGYQWNTFNTRGRCPDCGVRWLETQCLRCAHWSAHDAWYEEGDSENR